MEFKKCLRCGSFFMSDNNVCCNCEPKDRLDMANLSSFMSDNSEVSSIESLSKSTGISTSNLNRFIQDNSLPDIDIPS